MERIVRSWLEPGLTTLTDDVLDAVMDQLPATPQRRRWSARRIADMNRLAKYAIATAAVVVIALVGFNLLSSPTATARPAACVAVGSAGKQPASARADHQRRYRRRALSLDVARRRYLVRPLGRMDRERGRPHVQERGNQGIRLLPPPSRHQLRGQQRLDGFVQRASRNRSATPSTTSLLRWKTKAAPTSSLAISLQGPWPASGSRSAKRRAWTDPSAIKAPTVRSKYGST